MGYPHDFGKLQIFAPQIGLKVDEVLLVIVHPTSWVLEPEIFDQRPGRAEDDVLYLCAMCYKLLLLLLLLYIYICVCIMYTHPRTIITCMLEGSSFGFTEDGVIILVFQLDSAYYGKSLRSREGLDFKHI